MHVIRNAGGRASEAVRSLCISQQLLGTREVRVLPAHLRAAARTTAPACALAGQRTMYFL
jgi:carbonic anhydrase